MSRAQGVGDTRQEKSRPTATRDGYNSSQAESATFHAGESWLKVLGPVTLSGTGVEMLACRSMALSEELNPS
jgi:hypothetical protein